jgi:hypothetical protein
VAATAVEPEAIVSPTPQASAPRAPSRLANWLLFCAVACFAALALPFFVGQVYVADDLGEFHLPLRAFYAQQLVAGEPFDWMPSLYGGFYVSAEGQLGAYHPLHYLLYRWLPLGAAFDLELLISYPLLFAGMYFLLQRFLAQSESALYGALTFTFGGFCLLHFLHPNAIAIVAHLPWLLLAIDVALSAPKGPRRATAYLAIGLLTASQLLLGYPQYVWFSLLAEAAFAAWRAFAVRASLRRVGALFLYALLGVAAAAVQLLPTLDLLRNSTRGDADLAFANTGSLHPLNLVQFVAPYLFQTRVAGQNTHEAGLYVGAAPFLLCVWLLSQRARWGRLAPLVWATLVLGVASLVLAMGEAGGLYRLQQYLPVANRFRFPCRAIVLVQFAAATGAATAFCMLLETARGRAPGEQRRGDRALFVTLALSVALAVIGPFLWPQHVATAPLVWTGPALIAIGTVLLIMAQHNVRGAMALLALFTAVDLVSYGLSYSVWGRTADLGAFARIVSLPPGVVRPRVVAKEVDGLRTGNRMLLAGVSRVDGYAGLEPAKRLDYSTRSAQRRAGVEYQFSPASDKQGTAAQWTPVDSPAPRVRLVTRTPAEHAGATTSDDLAIVAADPPVDLMPESSGSAVVLADSPGHFSLESNAPSQQLLVTTESYHDGWVATVDGRVIPIVRVDGDFLGCVVDAGQHQVDLRFRPWSLQLGRMISFGGLGLLLCAFALAARRPRHIA